MIKKTFVVARLMTFLSLLGLLVISAGGCGDSGPLTIGKLKEKGSSIYDQEVRLSSKMTSGSIEWNAQNGILKFILTDGNDSINAVYQGADAETMLRMLTPKAAEKVDLILSGKYDDTGVFNVDSIDREEIPYCRDCHKS